LHLILVWVFQVFARLLVDFWFGHYVGVSGVSGVVGVRCLIGGGCAVCGCFWLHMVGVGLFELTGSVWCVVVWVLHIYLLLVC